MAAVEPLEVDDLEPGAWLDELVSIWKRDGELRQEAVENAARNPGSALHRYFEWDNKNAALRYRLIQAERLIRRATILVQVEDKSFRVRAFLHTSESGYQPSTRVMSTAALRADALERFRREAELFIARCEKYERVADVKSVLTELRRWLKEHSQAA